MSDFEGRLAEALRTGAEDAPDALGLADAARGRARARRRTRAAVAGAAAVAVLAVPVVVVALAGGDEGSGDPPVADDPASTSPDPFPDGRWETWHGVSVRVPGDWQYGDLATWCAGGGSETEFRVGRPGGPVPAIACTPGSSYGVTFQDVEMEEGEEPFDWPVVTQTGDAWPPGTFVGARGVNGVLVMVAGPDGGLVADVLSTVTPVDPVDPNGCSTTDDGGPGMAGAGEVPVCRYDAAGRLVQSERLTGEDAAAAVEAVRSTTRDDSGGDQCRNESPEYVVMGVEGDRVEVRYAGDLDCADQGVFVDGLDHALTADVLYWALSPGWAGGVAGHVPLPDPLRQMS